MLVELILGGVSLLLVLILVSIRYFSIAYAKNGTLTFSKSDKFIINLWESTLRTYRTIQEDVTDFFKDLPQIILHLLNRIFYKLYKKTKKLVDLIKGNKIKKDGGSVSVYLKSIEKKD